MIEFFFPSYTLTRCVRCKRCAEDKGRCSWRNNGPDTNTLFSARSISECAPCMDCPLCRRGNNCRLTFGFSYSLISFFILNVNFNALIILALYIVVRMLYFVGILIIVRKNNQCLDYKNYSSNHLGSGRYQYKCSDLNFYYDFSCILDPHGHGI